MTAEEPLDDLDARILTSVQDLYAAVDPVPSDLAMEIKFQLTVQALHAEVAELQRHDAPVDDAALVRSADYAQTETMTFSCDQLSAMITVTALDTESVRVDGWVTTGGCAVELRLRPLDGVGTAQVVHTTADDDGRFTFARVDKGMAQLVFRVEDDATRRPVITPHVEI